MPTVEKPVGAADAGDGVTTPRAKADARATGGATASHANIMDAAAPRAKVDASPLLDGGVVSADSTSDAATEPTLDSGVAELDAPDSGDASAVLAADAAVPSAYVALLSETGLYEDLRLDETLATGVSEYRPRFQLWSDGASKRRFISLPVGSQIDTSDMDYWVYPVGTRVWKEFTRAGIRIETRLLEKRAENDWLMLAYQWDDAQMDAIAVPRGVQNAGGTEHDIPAQIDCRICHDNITDRLLSVSAVQLDHDSGEPGFLTLASLNEQGQLTDAPALPLTLPGNAVAQKALGYLHANCGGCHNPRATAVFPTVNLDLWLRTDSLSQVEDTPTYRSTVGVRVRSRNSAELLRTRIVAGDPAQSAVPQRMSSRDPLLRMPPIASELVDSEGFDILNEWIESLETP